MALPIKLIAAITATTAAAGAGAYIALNSENAGPTASAEGSGKSPFADEAPKTADPELGSSVTLCVGADRILRVAPGFAAECPEGQQEFLLEDTDEQVCELCDPFEDPPDPGSDDKAVADLERRIDRLENPTYFEVLTQKEEPIFQVARGGVRIFNQQPQTVAFVGTPDDGAFFTARSPAGMETSLAASGTNAGVLIGDVNSNRIEIGSRNAGPYALRFPSGKGLIAGIGQSRAGSGAVLVGTLPGVTAGSITAGDRGMVSLTKDGRPGGIAFLEASIGGGMIDIGNDAGDSAVKMGHNGHRYGIVLTGPVPGFPYVPRSGLPGSYFMGCASGEKPACTPTAPE
jgi:hypothetical protein